MSHEGLPLPLVGKQVLVRNLEESDLSDLYAIESDPETKLYLSGPVTLSAEDWISGMKRILPLKRTLAVIVKDGMRLAGRASIWDYSTEHNYRELQVVISTGYHGKHIGREVSEMLINAAFADLGAVQVVGVVHPENQKSLKLLRHFGFRDSGDVVSDTTSKQLGFRIFELSQSAWRHSI